MDFYP